jgi:predicted DNA-binding transcriptional regulator AlpA
MDQTGQPSPLLKVPEASESILLERPAATYDKIKKKVFPPGVVVYLGDRSIRFHREKLLAWLESGGYRPNGEVSEG